MPDVIEWSYSKADDEFEVNLENTADKIENIEEISENNPKTECFSVNSEAKNNCCGIDNYSIENNESSKNLSHYFDSDSENLLPLFAEHLSVESSESQFETYELQIADQMSVNESINDRVPSLEYRFDDESTISNLDEDVSETATTCTNSSSGNASIETIEVYQVETDKITFNYRGPKVLPTNETPVTIAICDTIGALKSRKLFRILLVLGSNASLIKKSAH